MIANRDGHVRVLPLHVANKIAAGEVVERPASVVKELVENAIDAGARRIAVAVTQGGRKLVSVQDDGCGMCKDDALLSLERQATSKIRDVTDIEEIDTLGFRGEAIPSIASVSRFSLTTRRADSDEGTLVVVNAGTIAEVRAAGCPPGTLVEVRDLFCNVPARRKFLRAYATEESHVRQVFTVHALAHPSIGFTLTVDGREVYKLAPADNVSDRVRDLFGPEFLENALPVKPQTSNLKPQTVSVSGFIEKPNLATPSRRDQYIFVNGRPATSASIAYALREAYPRRAGDSRPAAVLFISLPPNQVDVNVHPTKREVRFRDNVAVKSAIMEAVGTALCPRPVAGGDGDEDFRHKTLDATPAVSSSSSHVSSLTSNVSGLPSQVSRLTSQVSSLTSNVSGLPSQVSRLTSNVSSLTSNVSSLTSPVSSLTSRPLAPPAPPPTPQPVPLEFAIEPDSRSSKPWQWFKFLAQSASGYLLIETDAGIVTINPHAARERIAYEKLIDASKSSEQSTDQSNISQTLLIPETVQLSPVDAARIRASLSTIQSMGFQLEEFGRDTFKIDAVPQLIGSLSPAGLLSTIASDLAESGAKRGDRWREELVAKSVARSFAGASLALTETGAVKLVEELCACRMPYVCPRGKLVMIFTSTRELDRKFDRS